MQQNSQSAYLIIRLGSRWNDVFRLEPNIPLVIGRASQNQIVVADERCSRHHAEIRYTPNQWVVRDLGSRNGTVVNSEAISGEVQLKEGDVIQVAACQMTFVTSLGQAFRRNIGTENPTIVGDDQRTMEHSEPQTITHRRREASWLAASKLSPTSSSPSNEMAKNLDRTVAGEESRSLQTATELFRLSYELAKEPTAESASQLALDRLLAMIHASAGGILKLDRRDKASSSKAYSMTLLATRERQGKAYHRVNDFLAESVLREGEAVLARNIQDDSQLIDPQASAVRRTTSVICAPIRDTKQVDGLLHIYSSDDESMLGPAQLEVAIAVAETLGIALSNLRSTQKLSQKLRESQRQIQTLQAQLDDQPQLFGSSPLLKRLEQQIARVGPTMATVLIRGESGAGKEVAARALHQNSLRREGPFIAINCAALSPTLLESELFGHEKGAFTGASERKIGKFELADHGTLMLDEIGEMSPEIQAKFLRALEGKPFERVGGSKPIQVDVRVIAATNRDLESAVKEGHFRADLYFRLRVIELQVPSLRDRPDDILPLANHFLVQFVEETGHGPKAFSPRANKAMREYSWPGNIRELKNAIERAVVLSVGEFAEPEDLALSHLVLPNSKSVPPVVHVERSLDEVEREHIVAVLEATNGHKSKTASILGIERSTLDRKLKRYNIESNDEETKG